MDRISNTTEYGSIVAVLILIIFILSEPLFHKLNFHYIHESGMCMMIGLFFSALDYILRPEKDIASEIRFDDEVFFNLILPPIIFSAGYNLKRKGFYKYFLYVICFGLIGTILNFLLVAPLTFIWNYYEMFSISKIGPKFNYVLESDPDILSKPLIFSISEVLLYSSVITATDTVAALTFVSENSDPKLFAILFGEGVVNDAVCIVLYKVVFKQLNSSESSKSLI